MRSLTKEEIDYLSENDAASMARIPVITMKADEGNYIYNKDHIMDNATGMLRFALQKCENRVPKERYSFTMVLMDSRGFIKGVATLDMGERMSPEERKAKNLDYPISLRDIWTIGVLSGASDMYFIFNHPEQYGSNAKKPSLYEDEIIFSQMTALDDDLTVKDIAAVNLDKMPLNYDVHWNIKNFDNLHERFTNRSRERKLTRQSRDAFSKYNRNTGKKYKEGINAEDFDFSFGGILPGMNKSHLEKWNFYIDSKQIEPITFEDWKIKEIQFTADKLLSNKVTSPVNVFDINDYENQRKFIAENESSTRKVDEKDIVRLSPANSAFYHLSSEHRDLIMDMHLHTYSLKSETPSEEQEEEEEDKEI